MNYEKLCSYVSSNIGFNIATNLADRCGWPLASDLEKYLGVPLIHRGITKDTYKYLVAKLEDRLTSWKIDTLSLVDGG